MLFDWNLCLQFCSACAAMTVATSPAPSVVVEPPKPVVASAPGVQLTSNEKAHLPTLKAEIESMWPDLKFRSALGGQVQQETCPSLKSKKCWSPTAELKTDREYGFGLGQLTVTQKFDNFKEARKLHSSLSNWEWDNRFNAAFQLRTVVLMDKRLWNSFSWAADPLNRMAFTLVGYNGGAGGVLSDRAVCRATPGCKPDTWFGHVEHTSKKSKKLVKGYGKPFFYINREYPVNILGFRKDRYLGFFGELKDAYSYSE